MKPTEDETMSGIVDLYGNPYRQQHTTTNSSGVRRRVPILASLRNERLQSLLSEGWRSLSGSGTPLYLISQEMMVVMSYWMYFTNDIIGGMIEKKTDIIVGNGFDFQSTDEQVAAEIERFWKKDKVNNFPWNQDIYVSELSIFGELCFTLFVNEYSGKVRVSTVDPYDIDCTITDPLNRNLVIGVKLKSTGSDDQILTNIIDPFEPDEETFSQKALEMRQQFTVDGEQIFCMFFPVNRRFVDHGTYGVSMRGTPDLLASFDPAMDAEEVLFSMRRRADMASRILWDVTYEGASQDDIDTFNEETPLPDEYTINAHNERIKWAMISPDLKASEHETQYRLIRNHTISGKGAGMPPTWFGDGTDANRASAQEMPFPTIKGLSRRQWKVLASFSDLISYQLYHKKLEPDFESVAPTISEKDFERLSNVLTKLTSSLVTAEDREWLTKEEARQIYRTSIEDFGTELGEYEEPPEDEQRMTEDYQHYNELRKGTNPEKENEEEGENDAP